MKPGRTIYFVLVLLTASAGYADEVVDASAERLTVDHRAGTALFEGQVRVTRGAMTLECARLQVRYDRAGKITTMEATGQVVVRTSDGTARAGRAQLDVPKNRLILTENPRVEREGGQLTGRRIEVDLDRERVRILDARGTFRFPAAR